LFQSVVKVMSQIFFVWKYIKKYIFFNFFIVNFWYNTKDIKKIILNKNKI
jgi:hypothetical protein